MGTKVADRRQIDRLYRKARKRREEAKLCRSLGTVDRITRTTRWSKLKSWIKNLFRRQ